MEYNEITKSEFNKNYNVDKVLTDKVSIMKQLETFNPNNQAVAFGIKKKPRDIMPIWFKEYAKKQDVFNETIMQEIRDIKIEIKDIKSRLDNIVIKNNLIE